MSIHEADTEILIASLCGSLDRADHEPFRQAAYAALLAVPCWGPGAVHRVLVATWRGFFHPPDVKNDLGKHADRRQRSKLLSAPPIEFGNGRRRRAR